jgi:hypothetical protein
VGEYAGDNRVGVQTIRFSLVRENDTMPQYRISRRLYLLRADKFPAGEKGENPGAAVQGD